ncbi:hypothetical protein jhhlp_002112 [Lomentospora prolificans]|uniref:DUF8021 domain-containing protein n=1 Tax=Lomentospora prolificans TaxID=41688 RepID=A0A2N3ND58_9PEZI|nr:hypothetical protein jhhlp_002112 [Lomentospora prolificans]
MLLLQLVLTSALTAAAAAASCPCTHQMLEEATKQYVEAQRGGDISLMPPLRSSLSYSENDVKVPLEDGIISQALTIDHDRSIHDTTACATFTEIVSGSKENPYVIATRMIFQGGKASVIESVVSNPGDWAFNATGYLYWNSLEEWDPIPEEDRDTREIIQAAGDAYFDRFNDTSVEVPFGTPCARLEGGAYTGRGNLTANTCDIGGMPSTIVVTNRRYVVDEAMGVVSIFLGFPGLDRSQGQDPMPDSHMFRVEKGKIRYIHTASACVEDGCGMDGNGPIRF